MSVDGAFPGNGTRGDQDRIGSSFLWRRIPPAAADAIVRARDAGVPARALAREYGVSVRTIYRAIEMANRKPVVVTIETWHAQFVVTDEGPVRVSAWLADPEVSSR